jgi:serine/threonine-protein kinase
MVWTLLRRERRTIGPYELVAKLGKGSAGSVFKARHGVTGNFVAIKVLGCEDAHDPVALKRFEQEFRATCILNHPHIVRGLDLGCDGHLPYFVMEFVEGESLGQHLKVTGRLAEYEALSIIIQIAQALHHAHQRGMIHRDVKPGNILLATDGVARLTDFGLVKCLESCQNLTATATSLGTACFMAPEQFDDSKRIDQRCDIYALAASLYMTVTGVVPVIVHGPRVTTV